MTLFSAISAAVINQGSQWEQSDLTQPTLTILLPFLRLQFWRESQLLQGNQKLISQTQPTEENCCKETNWFTLSGPVSALSPVTRQQSSGDAILVQQLLASPELHFAITRSALHSAQLACGPACAWAVQYIIRAADERSAKF